MSTRTHNQQSELVTELRERGIRMTPQRAIILQAIEGLAGHVTAEEIFDAVQKVNSYISLATIYRTLDMLKDLGLVAESHMGTTTTHYALRTHSDHHHAVCRICNRSIDLPLDYFESMAQRLDQEHHFVADVNHLVILGWCRECLPEKVEQLPELK